MNRSTLILLTAALAIATPACNKNKKKDDALVEKTQSKVDAKKKEAEELGLTVETWATYQDAVKLIEGGDRDAALDRLLGVIEAHPEFAEAHYNVAMIYEARGEGDRARAHLEKAREVDPSASEYKVAMGRIYAETGEFDRAKMLFDEVVARDPSNSEARNNLAILALKKGDLDVAKQHVIDILREDDDNVPALTTLGLIYKKQENLSLAKYVFEKAKGIDGKNADIHNNLGLVFMMEDNTPRAVSSFKKANEVDPTYVESRLNLGSILIEYLDYERANAQFEQVLAIEPDHCVANLGYGATQFAMGKQDEAIKRYVFYTEKCDKEHISSYERLAKLHEGSPDKMEAAIEYYRKLLTLTTEQEKQTQYKAMIQFLESQVKQQQPKQPSEGGGEPPAEGASGEDGSPEEGEQPTE